MLLGITLGQLLYRHAHKIAYAATQLCVWLQTEMLKRAIESFKHAPFGIKFNPLITHKVGYVLKFVVREFAQGVAFTAPVHVLLVMIVTMVFLLTLSLPLPLPYLHPHPYIYPTPPPPLPLPPLLTHPCCAPLPVPLSASWFEYLTIYPLVCLSVCLTTIYLPI